MGENKDIHKRKATWPVNTGQQQIWGKEVNGSV